MEVRECGRRAWRLAGLSSALAFPLDLGARPLCTLGSSLRSPAAGEGHEGFPPPPDKDPGRALREQEGGTGGPHPGSKLADCQDPRIPELRQAVAP